MATNQRPERPRIFWSDDIRDEQADPEIRAWVDARAQELVDTPSLGSIEHTEWLIVVEWARQPSGRDPGLIRVRFSW